MKLISFDVENRVVEFGDNWEKVYEKNKFVGEISSGREIKLSKKEIDKIGEFILSLKDK